MVEYTRDTSCLCRRIRTILRWISLLVYYQRSGGSQVGETLSNLLLSLKWCVAYSHFTLCILRHVLFFSFPPEISSLSTNKRRRSHRRELCNPALLCTRVTDLRAPLPRTVSTNVYSEFLKLCAWYLIKLLASQLRRVEIYVLNDCALSWKVSVFYNFIAYSLLCGPV